MPEQSRTALIRQIQSLLDTGDADVPEYIEQLARLHRGDSGLLDSLRNAVKHYDFDLATRLLRDYAVHMGVDTGEQAT